MAVLAAPCGSVTLLVSQRRFPVLMSKQTSLPVESAEKTQLPCTRGVEVLLRTRSFIVSGQRMDPDGLSSSTLSMRPLTRSRFLEKTGVATTDMLPLGNFLRQKSLPFLGSRLLTDCRVLTMSWRAPPAVITMGELWAADSSNALQTS